MQNKIIYLVIMLGISTNLFANEKSLPLVKQDTSTHLTEQYKEDLEVKDIADDRVGQNVVVFSEVANVNEHASEKSKKVGSLSIGMTVKILSRVVGTGKKNGFQDAWLKIEHNENGKLSTAYIWGGDLAIANLGLDEKNQLIVGIVGMKEPNDSDSYEKIAEVRIVNDKKIISRTSFTPIDFVLSDNHFTYQVKAEKMISTSLVPNVTIVALKFIYEACDYPNGDILFTWNGSKINSGPTVEVTNSPDYEIFRSFKYIMPSDPGGIHNCVMVKYTTTPNTEDSSKKKVSPVDTFVHYVWNGEKLADAEKCGK